jgi:hypothetical protein
MTENVKVPTTETVNDTDLAALTNAARELAQSDIIGLPLKFAKGRWFIKLSKEEEYEVTPTQTFVVDPISYTEGWYRWEDKKPFKIIGRRVDGFISPARSVLPDQEKRLWPVGPKGPEDPWQEVQLLLLRDLATGDLLTWTNNSYGGRRHCLGEFLDAYVREVKLHPGEDPIVLLQSWDRPSADWGNIPTPRLKIIGWQAFGEGRTPPGDPARGALIRETLLALPKPSLALVTPDKARRGGDMDDNVPF